MCKEYAVWKFHDTPLELVAYYLLVPCHRSFPGYFSPKPEEGHIYIFLSFSGVSMIGIYQTRPLWTETSQLAEDLVRG